MAMAAIHRLFWEQHLMKRHTCTILLPTVTTDRTHTYTHTHVLYIVTLSRGAEEMTAIR